MTVFFSRYHNSVDVQLWDLYSSARLSTCWYLEWIKYWLKFATPPLACTPFSCVWFVYCPGLWFYHLCYPKIDYHGIKQIITPLRFEMLNKIWGKYPLMLIRLSQTEFECRNVRLWNSMRTDFSYGCHGNREPANQETSCHNSNLGWK